MAAQKPNRLTALAAALLLGAACKRAPVEVQAETPELDAPAPSSTLISTPLDAASTGYTNEMQAANITRETTELGIRQISKEIEEDPRQHERADTPPLSEAEKNAHMAQLKEMRHEITRVRRGMDAARDKTVSIPGSTASLIEGRKSGAAMSAVEVAPGVWGGAYGGAVETGERVVEDPAAWTELWGRLSRETPPDVDFTSTRVAAVFVGPRPTAGYVARLVGIAVEPTRYLLRWFEEGPGPREAVADGITAPFLLVSVPRDNRAIRWDKARRAEGPKRK